MTSFDRDDLEWLETFFVMFPSQRRPTLAQVERVLKKLRSSFELHAPAADEQGNFESLTLISPEDWAAIDISFESGEAVSAEGKSLYRELLPQAADAQEKSQIVRLPTLDARLDLMHFGRVSEDAEMDDTFDPGALLVVVEALVKLTGGVGIDPQSGTLL